MHPEVIQKGPGFCPKCGMPLEPIAIAEEREDDQEYRQMRWRFWISLLFSIPVFFVAMGEMGSPTRLSAWLELFFSLQSSFGAHGPSLSAAGLLLCNDN